MSISGEWNYPFVSPTLTDTVVNGSLSPEQVTESSDGSTITAVWSDPALANQPLTFVRIFQSDTSDNSCNCDVEPSGSFYFTGHDPSVVVQSPGAQKTEAGTPLGLQECGGKGQPCCPPSDGVPIPMPCPGLQISAYEAGVSNDIYGDDPSSPDGTESPSGYSAIGLPPGLAIGFGLITGRPTTPGTYSVSVTATAAFNDNQQSTSSSTGFTWIITPKPVRIPRVPVFDGAPYRGKGLQVRPFAIVYTGDGSGVLAGARRGSRKRRALGHLRWAKWTAAEAVGSGEDWVDNCNPDCASGKFMGYPVKIRLYRPEYEHGFEVFTRMSLHYTKRRPRYQRSRFGTLKVIFSNGSFGWS